MLYTVQHHIIAPLKNSYSRYHKKPTWLHVPTQLLDLSYETQKFPKCRPNKNVKHYGRKYEICAK